MGVRPSTAFARTFGSLQRAHSVLKHNLCRPLVVSESIQTGLGAVLFVLPVISDVYLSFGSFSTRDPSPYLLQTLHSHCFEVKGHIRTPERGEHFPHWRPIDEVIQARNSSGSGLLARQAVSIASSGPSRWSSLCGR